MSEQDPWWKRLDRKATEKVADSFLAWLIGLGATSGFAVAAKSILQHRAPDIFTYAVAVGPWALAAIFALLFLLTGLRARILKREAVSLLESQDRPVSEAAARARNQLGADLRAQWAEDTALEAFGLEPIDAWCFVHKGETTWALHSTIRAWSAIP